MLLILLISSCKQSEYSKLVKREIATERVNDSLFFGLKIGDSKQEFFDKCWKLNSQKLVKHGPSNNFVQYNLPSRKKDSANKKLTMLFYGIFNEEKTMTGLDLKFYYDSWALWNESAHSDKLLPVVKDSLLKWFPGNNFIKIPLKKGQEEVFVKVDGYRRILIESPVNNREVDARIDDLRFILKD
ncbi:hypothetical protein ABN763_07525 [Spongiivirga sp. MCCC 1A20706]|uniref:hypothetical protein n=1 Tax=Spongiivirga sp. MCCC 1A20706 TaxID=3160963 RepID=UPI003977C63B